MLLRRKQFEGDRVTETTSRSRCPLIAAKTRAVSFFMLRLAFVFELVTSRSSPAMILRSTFVYLPLANPVFLGSYQRSINNRSARSVSTRRVDSDLSFCR